MIDIICNPTSGTGRGLEVGKEIDALLTEKKLGHHFYLTEYPAHATELARRSAMQHTDIVLSVGGDGTTLEVACGLAGTTTMLGIIPAGTGNDFIKTINLPKDPMQALETILRCAGKKTDLIRLNDRYFLNETGTGFDVCVLDYAEKAKKHCRGLMPYLYGVICTIFKFKPVSVTYSLDGGAPVSKELLVFGAGNGRFIGGGIEIAPEAVPDDGLLDIVIINKMKKLRMVSVLLPLLKGKILTFKETEHLRASHVVLDGKDMRLNVDGEIFTMNHAELTVLPGALLVIRP